MKKIFISQPFHGRSEKEIFAERDWIKHRLEAAWNENVEVIDQYHQKAPEGAGRFYYLSQDILMMEQVDVIVFAPNWWLAKGCRVERELAKVYDLNILTMFEEDRLWVEHHLNGTSGNG